MWYTHCMYGVWYTHLCIVCGTHSYAWCVVHTLLNMVCGVHTLCMVCGTHIVIYGVWYTHCYLWCVVHTLLLIVYGKWFWQVDHSKLFAIKSTKNGVQ